MKEIRSFPIKAKSNEKVYIRKVQGVFFSREHISENVILFVLLQVHVAVMSLTVAATATAFILSFIYAKDWSGVSALAFYEHVNHLSSYGLKPVV